MKILILFLVCIQFARGESSSLSCSKAKTFILFINGINNEEREVIASTEVVRDLINKGLTHYDINGQVEIDYSYNSSEGFLKDKIQMIDQKLAGDKNDINLARALYFFSPKIFILNQGLQLYKDIELEIFKSINTGKYNSVIDTAEMIAKVDAQLELGNKIIIISHSQGNIYANYVYEGLLKRGRSRKELSKYLGNLQVGSVASKVKAKNNRVYTFMQDIPVNYMRTYGSVLKADHFITVPALCAFTGVLCHEFLGSYLSPYLPVIGPKQGESIRPVRFAESIFLDSLEEVAWMLANNDPKCCEGEDGRFRYNSKSMTGEEIKELGGFVDFKSEVDKDVYLEKDSFICDSKVKGKVQIKESVISNSSLNGNTPNNLLITRSKLFDTQIEGNLWSDCATVHRGTYVSPSNQSVLWSACNSERVFEDNIASGYFGIHGGAKNLTLNAGEASIGGLPAIQVLNSLERLGENVTFNGYGDISNEAYIGNGITINGYYPGVAINGESSVQGPSTIMNGNFQIIDTKVMPGSYIDLDGSSRLNRCDVYGVELIGSIDCYDYDLTSNLSGNYWCHHSSGCQVQELVSVGPVHLKSYIK